MAPKNKRKHKYVSPKLDVDVTKLMAAYHAGQYRKVERVARVLLARHPDHGFVWKVLGAALTKLGEHENALSAKQRAVEFLPTDAEAHSNLANSHLDAGNAQAALEWAQQALSLNPGLATAYNNLGRAYTQLGKYEEARNALLQALALHPEYAQAYHNLGVVCFDLGQIEEALEYYQRARELQPDNPQTHANLLEILEKTNRSEEIPGTLARARQSVGDHPLFSIIEARLLKDEGALEAACTLIETLPMPRDPMLATAQTFLLGEIRDRLGSADDAFAAFAEGNRLAARRDDARHADKSVFLTRIKQWHSFIDSISSTGWQKLPRVDERTDPVFLLGFPRSGTTLLDTMLRSHPHIDVLEEPPTIDRVHQCLTKLPGGDPNGLIQLDAAGLLELRDAYFNESARWSEQPFNRNCCIIDKMPLNTIEAALIYRIFPRARFLLMLRHPCDCVLSCFMQNFALNDAMANFLSLQDAAHFYDQVMRLWERNSHFFQLSVHTLHYEDLVSRHKETIKPLLDFLDVGWDAGIIDYMTTAKTRKRIKTASYNQVIQPLYTRSVQRWERYRRHMEPVLPILFPWAERFGYTK